MELKLPKFNPTSRQRSWVNTEIETARLIRALWTAGGRRRRDSDFIALLIRCGWTNVRGDDSGYESTRTWRNNHIADYLQVEYESDAQLASELASAFPRLKQPSKLVQMHTGITHYYKALRPETVEFIKTHSKYIAEAFQQVASPRPEPVAKIKRVVNSIVGLGAIHIREKEISPLNGLTPTLACLDPSRRFPIMNEKTRRLLQAIGHRQDSQGAVALSKLIGSHGIRNSFDLDVYGATTDFSRLRKRRHRKFPPGQFKDVGLKSEVAGYAYIAKNRYRIRKLHNRLTNLLEDYLKWRHLPLQECQFDGFVPDWKPGRHLLIEAKTASAGTQGRMQVRQAIGQLFDYRQIYASRFPPGKVDLAVLLPSKPSADIHSLLRSLGIEVLWFKRLELQGTITL